MIYTGTYHVLLAPGGTVLSYYDDSSASAKDRAIREQEHLERRSIDRGSFVPVSLHTVRGRRPAIGSTLYLCCYCGGRVASRGLAIDGEHAHKTCHKEACE